MLKIGVYVFTDQIKKRETKKREGYFDGQNYIGLRYLLSELDSNDVDISYVSKDTINTVDFCLISLTSYYDVINVINELHGKIITAKVCIGGAGFNNVGLLREIADIGTVGRGEGTLPKIIRGEKIDGLYYKEDNFNLSKPIKIMPLKTFIEIDDNFVGKYCEQSIGCQRKCYFCEYSWKHKWTRKDDGYHSGLMNRETLLQDVDWSSYHNKDLVTAIDGATEKTRNIINKPISNQAITQKMLEIYDTPRDYVSLKLYCLLGYPFEKKFEPEEAVESIISARKPSDHRCNVLIVSPHFMPMPFTPMECEPVNWHNFRDDIKNYNWEKFGKGNINVYWNWSLASSPISAAEATVLNRADINDIDNIKKVMCSSKYKSLDAKKKRLVLEKYFGHLLGEVDDVFPYIIRNNPTEKAKEVYKKRKAAFENGGNIKRNRQS